MTIPTPPAPASGDALWLPPRLPSRMGPNGKPLPPNAHHAPHANPPAGVGALATPLPNARAGIAHTYSGTPIDVLTTYHYEHVPAPAGTAGGDGSDASPASPSASSSFGLAEHARTWMAMSSRSR